MHAAEVLGKFNDTRAVGPLIQALKDEDSMVRWDAVDALGNLNDTRAVKPLIQALKDEDSEIREKATETLIKLRWEAP